MRGVGVIGLSALLSGFLAGTLQLQMAIWYDSHEEFIVAELGLMLLVIATAAIFAVALAMRAGRHAVARIALAIAAVVVLSVAGLEAVSLVDSGPQNLLADVPVLNEILAPGLLAILIQWWLVRRHVVKLGR